MVSTSHGVVYAGDSMIYFMQRKRTNALTLFFENFIYLLEQKLERDKIWRKKEKCNRIYFYFTEKNRKTEKKQVYTFICKSFTLSYLISQK